MSSAKFALTFIAALMPAAICSSAPGRGAETGPPFVRETPTPTDPASALAEMQRSAAFEKAASQFALERTHKERVRTLAQDLLQHSQILDASLEAVSKQGANLPQSELLASQRQSVEQLRRLVEPNFDARYLEAMRGQYEQWLQDLKSFDAHGADGPVKNLVRQAQSRAEINLRAIRAAQDEL